VHFPIALIFVGFLFDLVSFFYNKEFFNKAGFIILILGTLGVIAAYLSGEYAGEGVVESGALGRALELHESAAQLSLWLMVGVALVRIAFVLLKKYSGVFKIISLILFLLGVLSIARTGYYGGELVFKHAAGVQLNIGLDFESDVEMDNADEDAD